MSLALATKENALSGEGHSVRFGLGTVKNVGDGAAQAIVDERERGGPFKSLDELCQRGLQKELGTRAFGLNSN